VLPYTIWMPVLDTAHGVTFASPTTTEVVVTTPTIPGLELRIPPHTIIRDHDGKPVTTVTITPVPLDAPHFRFRRGSKFPCISRPSLRRDVVRVWEHGPARCAIDLPERAASARTSHDRFLALRAGRCRLGGVWPWRVTADRQQIVPDPGVEVYEFTGAMVAGPTMAPSPAPPPNGKSGGDPVDLYTGLFVLQKTDLALRMSSRSR